MKKFLITFILLSATLPANSFVAPDAAIIQVHDMQMIKQQKFRMEEINDYKEVQEEKERFQKRNFPEKSVVKDLTSPKQFVEQDGIIKIEKLN